MFGMLTSGEFTNYLQSWFKPYLLAAVIMMGFLAIWSLLTASDNLDEETSGEATAHPVSGHHHHWPRVVLTLLVPTLTLAIATPSALNTDAALKQAAVGGPRVANREPIDFDPLSDMALNELTVQDYADRYILGRPEELENKRVRMTGFVASPDSLPDGQWTVNRFRIYCCAADANLYSVAIGNMELPQGENVWVEVEGILNAEKSDALPVLDAITVTVIDEPSEPYL